MLIEFEKIHLMWRYIHKRAETGRNHKTLRIARIHQCGTIIHNIDFIFGALSALGNFCANATTAHLMTKI